MNAPESETTPGQAPASLPTLTIERIALSMLGLLALHAVREAVAGISNLVELMPLSGLCLLFTDDRKHGLRGLEAAHA